METHQVERGTGLGSSLAKVGRRLGAAGRRLVGVRRPWASADRAAGGPLGPLGARSRTLRPGYSLSVMAVAAIALLADRGLVRQPPPGPATADVASEVAIQPALSLEMNDRVEKWMKRFTTDGKAEFQLFLGREGLYGGLIHEKLRDRGMPRDLLYLAMIESGFSTRATSPDSAAGVWQFMGPTALQYGLRVDQWVDERRDPVKGTDAALDYLEFLHARYDSWFLAAAAYNAGPARVDQVVRLHAGGRIGDEQIYWEIIDHLPPETREYVPKLLAATRLARQAERYGFKVTPVEPYAYDRVWVPGATSLSAVAKAIGTEAKTMRDLNPQLVMGWTPPGSSYALRVPKGRANDAIAALNRHPRATLLAMASAGPS